MAFKVYVTRRIPDAGLALLKKKKNFKVSVWPKSAAIPRKTLLKKVKGMDAILPLLSEKINGEVMDAAGPQLKVIANYAVGYDNIDVEAATKRGIIVTNTPGVLTQSVAEHTIAMMMAVGRRLHEADRYIRAGKYKVWQPKLLLGMEFSGKTIGIIGAGRIGSIVAKFAHDGLGMKILYTNRSRKPKLEKKFGAKKVSKMTLLKKSDVVTLHVPLLDSTRHLIGTPEFKVMKKTAVLINTARGPVIDEKALLKALYKKEIMGAGLDVFECEPSIDCNTKDHYALRELDNVMLTPHIASATTEARDSMAVIAANNIIAVLGKKKPLTQVK